jgi:nucleoside-diphosphate-sugar epimerase
VTAPTIYGIGNGLFNRTSIQIDAVIRAAQLDGYAVRVGSGSEEWDHVHIADLVKLYETILARVLAGDDLPSNKNGVYFAETGHHSWKELSDRVAKEGKALGYLKSDVVREVGLKDGSAKLHVPELVVELGFASRSRTQAEKSREIGWAPTKTRQDFEDSFLEEWKFLAKAAKWSV